MVAKTGEIVNRAVSQLKEHEDDIILAVGVFLISLLSFAVGYLVAKEDAKEPLRIESPSLNIETER